MDCLVKTLPNTIFFSPVFLDIIFKSALKAMRIFSEHLYIYINYLSLLWLALAKTTVVLYYNTTTVICII